MSYAFLQTLIGKDIQFTHKIEDLEDYAEDRMRATITGIKKWDGDNADACHEISIDYSKFDEYNRQFESYNYWDKLGNATLNAREAGYYTVKDTLYLDNSMVPFVPYYDDNSASIEALRFEVLVDPAPIIFKHAGGDDVVAFAMLWHDENSKTVELVSPKLAEYLGVQNPVRVENPDN